MKKATANNLTFENIVYESFRKGIDVIGVVDCISPYVLEDINDLIARGEIVEKSNGGMEYRGSQSLILGAEIETHEKHKVVVGVRDRLEIIKDRDKPNMNSRPPYNYHIPLEFLPKIGPKTIEKLINHFGS